MSTWCWNQIHKISHFFVTRLKWPRPLLTFGVATLDAKHHYVWLHPDLQAATVCIPASACHLKMSQALIYKCKLCTMYRRGQFKYTPWSPARSVTKWQMRLLCLNNVLFSFSYTQLSIKHAGCTGSPMGWVGWNQKPQNLSMEHFWLQWDVGDFCQNRFTVLFKSQQ